MIVDGRMTQEHPADGPYIYQQMHFFDGKLRGAKAHIEIINRSAEALFGQRLQLSAQELESITLSLIKENNLLGKGSIKVTLRLDNTAEYSLVCSSPTIYNGYAMRSIRPKACYIELTSPTPLHPTSAMEHTMMLAEAMAHQKDIQRAILTDSEGIIIPDAIHPLIAIGGRTILTYRSTQETQIGAMVLEIAQKNGYTIRLRDMRKADLAKAEELMIADWGGITAIASLAGRAYNYIAAEHIAKTMEQEYNKKSR